MRAFCRFVDVGKGKNLHALLLFHRNLFWQFQHIALSAIEQWPFKCGVAAAFSIIILEQHRFGIPDRTGFALSGGAADFSGRTTTDFFFEGIVL